MARVRIQYIYPPIPDRRMDFQAWYEGEEDERMDVGYGVTAKAAKKELLDNYERPFDLGDWLLDRSPFIIVRQEGSYYGRVSPLEWLKFIFHSPTVQRRGGAYSYPKCLAAIEVPFTRRAFGYDFIIAREYKIWNEQAQRDLEWTPDNALTWCNAWRWTNPLVEYL